MRYLITFGYDGTKFHGFQRQKDVKNVQSYLENALSKVLNEEIQIKGSGRTDAGVHAIGQTAHFDTKTLVTKQQLTQIIKEAPDLNIKNIKKVSNNFHARHCVKKKKYTYKINIGKYDSKLEGYYYQPFFKIDLSKIKEAKDIFCGAHDFRNFVSGSRDDYTTYINKVTIKKKGDIIEMTFIGAGFYRYMVRNIVGALLDLGKGKVSKAELISMLDDYNIHRQLSTAPADGLYLIKVYY